MGTYQPEEFIFQCPIFMPFHTVHEVIKARILKWFAIPFSRRASEIVYKDILLSSLFIWVN